MSDTVKCYKGSQTWKSLGFCLQTPESQAGKTNKCKKNENSMLTVVRGLEGGGHCQGSLTSDLGDREDRGRSMEDVTSEIALKNEKNVNRPSRKGCWLSR